MLKSLALDPGGFHGAVDPAVLIDVSTEGDLIADVHFETHGGLPAASFFDYKVGDTVSDAVGDVYASHAVSREDCGVAVDALDPNAPPAMSRFHVTPTQR